MCIFDKMTRECNNHFHDIPYKHIAVLTKGVSTQPILKFSFNHTSNTDISVHAEIAAITSFFKKKGYYGKWHLL